MNSAPDWVVDGVLRATLGLSLAAIFVAVANRVLRLRSPRTERWVWALVLAQGVLLVPLAVSVPSSWLGLAEAKTNDNAKIIPRYVMRTPDPAGLNPAADAKPATKATVSKSLSATDTTRLSTSQSSIETLPAAEPAAGWQWNQVSWFDVFYVAWIVGMSGFIGLAALRYAAFVRRLKAGAKPCPAWSDELQRVCGQQKISRPIPLIVCEDLAPALCLSPSGYCIVVPRSLWERLAPTQRESILRHELAHFQRGDLWTALVARSVALVHWFNPLAWWALARFEAQAEFACDHAAAIDSPTVYAAALIDLGSVRPGRLLAVQSARTGNLVERVKRLLAGDNRTSSWKAAALVAVAALALLPTAVRLTALAEGETGEKKITEVQPAEPTGAAPKLASISTDNLRIQDVMTDIAFSPDGKWVAASVANGETPRAWLFDVATGREVKRIVAPADAKGWIRCVTFSPDQTKLLWGEIGGYVALWDLANDLLLYREKIHGGGVNGVAFSANGEMFASAGDDGLVHVLKAADPDSELQSFEMGQPAPRGGDKSSSRAGAACVAFAMDDTRLIAGSGGAADISIWNLADGSLERQIKAAHGASKQSYNPKLNCLTVSADGRRLLSSGQHTVQRAETKLQHVSNVVTLSEATLWDIETGKRIKDLHGPEDYGFGFASMSPDGKHVAVADFSLLRILDVESGKELQSVSLPGCWGSRPEFSPDGRIVALGISGSIGLFDVTTGKRLHHDDRAPDGGVDSAAWSPDGNRIVTGHGDGEVRVWDARSGEPVWHAQLAPVISRSGWNASPAFVSYTPDSRYVIAAGRRDDPVEYRNGIVKVFDAGNGEVVRELHFKELRHAALSSDGKVLVVGSSHGSLGDTHLTGIEVETGKTLYTTPPESQREGYWDVATMQFRPGTSTLQIAMTDGEILFFDGATGEEQRSIFADWRSQEQRETGRPKRADLWNGAFSADGKTLVTSSAEYVYVWDIDTKKMKLKLRHPHDHGCRLAISPDARIIATSDSLYAGDYGRDTIRLYDAATGEPLMKAEPDDRRAGVLVFSPDGGRLFSGYHRGSANVWDVVRP